MKSYEKSIFRLFKSLPVGDNATPEEYFKEQVYIHNFRSTIPYGFIPDPNVSKEYNIHEVIALVKEFFGLSGEQLNATFHKSWKKVANADIRQLVIEQIIHYMTTYGAASDNQTYTLDWNQEYIYIPDEQLQLPDINSKDLKILVIKGLTKNAVKEKVFKLISSGIALSDDTLIDIGTICKEYLSLTPDDILEISNKEVRCLLFDHLKMIPENPIEFLRLLVYKLTGSTLLIKSKEVIALIKSKDSSISAKLLGKYAVEYDLKELSTIFFRFKPIFLAMKGRFTSEIINKLRKLANTYHNPMPEDILNGLTSKKFVGVNELDRALEKANIFRKIRLAYALKYRSLDVDSILYRIRNGKGYATEYKGNLQIPYDRRFNYILENIVDSMPSYQDIKIYIPSFIDYPLPATEKMFTGFFPTGTCVTLSEDMIFGVHWENVKDRMIDIDLSMISATTKFGWDGAYRNGGKSLLFSGDITNAPLPKGATECYYVAKNFNNDLIVLINFYNFAEDIEVPFKIFVAQNKLDRLPQNYAVNPNEIKAMATTKISKERQKTIGLISATDDYTKFYFCETYMGKSISASGRHKYIQQTRDYYMNYFKHMISLRYVLEKAGAILVDSPDESDIDLSPEKLEKDTIIKLLIKE